MRKTLTPKQEKFVRNLFEGMSQREAYINAGYSSKSSPAILDIRACEAAKASKVLVRLEELRKKAEDKSVASVLERKQVLTEIIRARHTDFMTCSADGVWFHDIGPEKLNLAALKQIQTTTMPFGDKESPDKVLLTKVELNDPIRAIAELNKMGGDYAPEKHELSGKDGGPIEIDHRAALIGRINNIVARSREKQIPERTDG